MSDKPLYDELMNLVTEIGELEVENKLLKDSIVNLRNLELQIKAMEHRVKYYKSEVLELNGELEKIKTDIKTKGFKTRLRYLFTHKL